MHPVLPRRRRVGDGTLLAPTAAPGAGLSATTAHRARPEGLRTRPWFRNLIYVADENNGYANMVYPSVNEAIRAGDMALVDRELKDLASRFDDATRAIRTAREALRR